MPARKPTWRVEERGDRRGYAEFRLFRSDRTPDEHTLMIIAQTPAEHETARAMLEKLKPTEWRRD